VKKDKHTAGTRGVRPHPKKSGVWIADLAIAGLGRVDLGEFDTVQAAAREHDRAKVCAAHRGLTAKGPERQSYNYPEEASELIRTADTLTVPEAVLRMASRRGSVMAASLGIKVREVPTANKVVRRLTQMIDALESRIEKLEAVRVK